MKIPHDKKIALCINSLNMGGAEKVVVTLINHFCKVAPVHLICLEKQGVFSVPEGISVHYLSRMTGSENNLFKFFMLPVLAVKLKRLCRKFRIQVVQSHLSRANYVSLLAKIFGTAHISHIVIHGITGEYRKKGLKGFINLLIIRILYHKADRIFVNSLGVKYNLASYLGTGKRIEIIHNAFDIEEIQRNRAVQIKSEEFIYLSGNTYIITVGRLIASKRHIDLLHAFKTVVETVENCELLIIGEGEEEYTLRKYIEENNLVHKVHLLGRVDNPYKYLYQSHLFVSASESESFGNVIIEAMACNCPVIAVDCPYGPREILAPESNPQDRLQGIFEEAAYGILSPVRNPVILAAAMIRMLRDDNLRRNYRERAASRCRLFDVKKIGELYKDFLAGDLNAV